MHPLQSLRRSGRALDGSKPLLVLLHGLGSDERDLMGATGGIDPRFEIVALRAPLRYEGGGHAWFSLGIGGSGIAYNGEEAKSSLELLRSTVVELAQESGTPSDQVVVGGFSQGAIMSLSLLLNYPEVLGGALLLSGAVLPELVPKELTGVNSIPILIHHGTYDPVLPVRLGHEIRDLLLGFGFAPTYREFPMAHGISPESLSNAEGWLADFADRYSRLETN